MEAVITSVLEEHVTRIQRAFLESGFVQTGELADRHGALQLTFAKESKWLARFVLLNEAVGTGEDDYRGAIDVVVQLGDRFVRRRVIGSRSREAFEREITGEAIAAAIALANSLTSIDLADSFALLGPQSAALEAEQSQTGDEATLQEFRARLLVVIDRYIQELGMPPHALPRTAEEYAVEIMRLFSRHVDSSPESFRLLCALAQRSISRDADRMHRVKNEAG